MICYYFGFIFCCLLLLISFLYIWYRKCIEPILSRRLPPKNDPPRVPKDAWTRIIQMDQIYHGQAVSGESVEWLNMMVSNLFQLSRDTVPLRESLFSRSLAESAVDVRRGKLGRIVRESRLEDVRLGHSLPHLSRVGLMKDSKGRIPLTWVADLSYSGGLGGILWIKTIWDCDVYIMGGLQRLEGRLMVMLDEKSFHLTFSRIDSLEIEARVNVAGREWRALNWIMSRFLLPWKFKNKYLLPGMKSKWIVDGPSKPKYPWDPEVVANPDLLYQEI